jgi:hypothetical protein
LYSAGLIIASEIRRSPSGEEKDGLLGSLFKCIDLLESSKNLNVVAEKAVEHLSSFIIDLDKE